MRPSRALPLIPLLLLAPLALASSGDRHGSYLECHAACTETCDEASIPAGLRALAWDCASECSYECAHALTDASDAGTEYYHQFHGKWAFHRWAGMQEPASVILSIGNLLAHWRGLQLVRRRVPRANGLGGWLRLAAGVHINTWIWSAVFHTRDLPWTERLDYFSATVTVGVTLHYALIRVFGLQGARSHSAWLAPVSALLALIVVGHFAYVSSLPLFPYGYHIAVAAALGMLGNLVWVGWSASFVARPRILGIQWPAPYPPGPRTPRRNWTPALLVALTIAAMSLELLDFPPILRVLDAHAAWHAATIPLALAWWDFLVKDALVLEGQATGRLD